MANPFIRRIFLSGALCAGAAFLLTSCIDDSYDLDKVDLTMGLGSEGLAVKFGNTEKILLNDILETDNSVKVQEGTNLYYLVENGSTNINMTVDKFSTSINDTHLNMNAPVLTFADVKQAVEEETGHTFPSSVTSVPISSGFSTAGNAEGNEKVNFNVKDVKDVSYIKDLDIEETDIKLNLNTVNTPSSMPFGVQKLENMKITIPTCLKVVKSSVAAGWVLDEATNTLTCASMTYSAQNPTICSMKLNKIVLERAPKNNQVTFTDNELTMHMEGKVTFGASRNFDMGKNDVASVRLDISIGNQQSSSLEKLLTVKQVTGKFTPAIDPAIEPINISNSLPDFLKDEEVEIDVANPTLRFKSDFTHIPVGVDLSGTLTSVYKKASDNVTITLPKQSFDNNKNNYVYYYQGTSPYDPEGLPTAYSGKTVSNLGTLIKKLPEQINVDLKNGQVAVKDQEYTIELGKKYAADANYNVFVPFEFNKRLTIVYRDSTKSMNDDLKDYSADGIRVNGTAQNAIPLDLVVTLEALDVDDTPIPGITFTTARVSAGTGESYLNENGETEWKITETPLEIEASLSDPKSLSKVDKLVFKVNAANEETTQSHKLISTQYLRVANIKLRLKGAVTADFN